MLEIKVYKDPHDKEQNNRCFIIEIKQSYQFTLHKDGIDIKLPSFYRPVFKVRTYMYLDIHRKHWDILIDAINNKTSFTISSNTFDVGTDGHCVELLSHSQNTNVSYMIPIEEHKSEIIQMIKDIKECYSDDPEPEVFKYKFSDFPVYQCIQSYPAGLIDIICYEGYCHRYWRWTTGSKFSRIKAWINSSDIMNPVEGIIFDESTNMFIITCNDGDYEPTITVSLKDIEKFKHAINNYNLS